MLTASCLGDMVWESLELCGRGAGAWVELADVQHLTKKGMNGWTSRRKQRAHVCVIDSVSLGVCVSLHRAYREFVSSDDVECLLVVVVRLGGEAADNVRRHSQPRH